jgi:hypothetical protein
MPRRCNPDTFPQLIVASNGDSLKRLTPSDLIQLLAFSCPLLERFIVVSSVGRTSWIICHEALTRSLVAPPSQQLGAMPDR